MDADSVNLWTLGEEVDNGGFGIYDEISDIDGSSMRPEVYVTPDGRQPGGRFRPGGAEFPAQKMAPKPVLATVPAKPGRDAPKVFARIMESEAARTPDRFRTRVLNQFRSPENIAYLKMRFARDVPAGPMRKFAVETCEDAIYNFERFYDLINSDSTLRRSWNRAGFDMWAEVRRINMAFYSDRMALLREHTGLLEPPKNVTKHDFTEYESEQYHMRMFISDSLRPPGLEHLNNPGPLYDLREDQVMFRDPPVNLRAGPAHEFKRSANRLTELKKAGAFRQNSVGLTDFDPNVLPRAAAGPKAAGPKAAASKAAKSGEKKEKFAGSSEFVVEPQLKLLVDNYTPNSVLDWPRDIIGMYDEAEETVDSDDAYDVADPDREPEQAIAEYWGENRVASTSVMNQEKGGKTYGEVYAWGSDWKKNGGERFMRYPSIMFWQKGGRQGYDYDIEETLGTAARETGNPVYRVDLDRMRNPKGQEYRRYGARSAYMP